MGLVDAAATSQINESFLLLFFKKEGLSNLPFNIQTVCKPGSVHILADAGRPFLWDRCCHLPRRDQPGRRIENTPAPMLTHGAGRPYSVLLPVGFTLPTLSPGLRCALTAPFHPCRRRKAPLAVCFLWHCPWGRPRRPLAGTVFPWSPDFPPARLPPPAAVQPSGWLLPAPTLIPGQPGRRLSAVDGPPHLRSTGRNTSRTMITAIDPSCTVEAPSSDTIT